MFNLGNSILFPEYNKKSTRPTEPTVKHNLGLTRGAKVFLASLGFIFVTGLVLDSIGVNTDLDSALGEATITELAQQEDPLKELRSNMLDVRSSNQKAYDKAMRNIKQVN